MTLPPHPPSSNSGTNNRTLQLRFPSVKCEAECMSRSPVISVVVTAYSRRQFLRGAIESVLRQTLDRHEYEVIVLKDFEENTLDSFLDKGGVRVYHDEMKVGRVLARGIRLARGDIVCFLDDDDEFLPTKLNYVKTVFDDDPGLGYLHNSFIVDNGGLTTTRPTSQPPSGKRITFNSMHTPGRRLKLRAPWFGFNLSSVSVRKKWVLGLLPLLEQIEAAISDGFFIVAALSKGIRATIDPAVLTVYRYHDSSTHFLDADSDRNAVREREHMSKLMRSWFVIQRLAEGTPMEAVLRYDFIYWRIRQSLFDEAAQLRLGPADVAFFIRGGILRGSLHPFYLLPAYLATRVAPRTVRALFQLVGTRFGHKWVT